MITFKDVVPSGATKKFMLVWTVLLSVLLHHSLHAVEASIDTHLIVAEKSKFELPEIEMAAMRREKKDDNKVCVYAEGLASNYTVINDACGRRKWRPGQAWRFDKDYQGYQPIRIGHNLCMDIKEQKSNSTIKVDTCSQNSMQVSNRQLWKIGCNSAAKCWFRNLLTDYCLTASAEYNAFLLLPCTSRQTDGDQMFAFQKPKDTTFITNIRGVVY
ncbi:hypothetical protein BDF22DRAFT_743864 [Syncephalis plumigaleata]|nr:hypothetical protein BDF22DRAFT_743864 [Syncephalis plumigaleata]